MIEDKKHIKVEENLGLVGTVVKKYNCPAHLKKEDLYQAGVLGLYQAIEKYDKTRDMQFSTYAIWCIKNSISTFVRRNRVFYNIDDLYHKAAESKEEALDEVIDIEDALKKLRKQEYKVIKMLYYDDLTLQQSAKLLNISHTSVARLRDRAIQKVKETIS